MKLYRIDAVHENECGMYHGEFTRFARFDFDAKVAAAMAPGYAGWHVDLYEFELPPGCASQVVDRLCSQVWPNEPIEKLLALAAPRQSSLAEAEQRLKEILSTRDKAVRPLARRPRD